jgi:sialate O-acetylesterase
VAYFFARELFLKTGIPQGIVQCEWGGTPAEAWTSREAIQASPDLRKILEDLPEMEKSSVQSPVFKSILQKFNSALFQHDPGSTQKWWQENLPSANQDWKTMMVPNNFETAGVGLFDGVVWFRKEIDVSPGLAYDPDAMLRLSKIDDMDSTWVNGIKIGGARGYDRNRNYFLRPGILKPGKNVIAIRVIDFTGNGGLWGDKNDMRLQGKTESVSLAGEWKYKVSADAKNLINLGEDVRMQNQPTTLYNAMIHPLLPLALKGVIWYQGESNADRAEQYQKLFPAMIQDWRKNFGQGDFPFYFVQLANYMKADTAPSQSKWAELREAQFKTLSVSNTGMATAIDIGEALDIHPKNKQDVGLRLAIIALARDYGLNIPFENAVYESHQKQGQMLRLKFKNLYNKLICKDKYGYVKGFALAGADKKFYFAQGKVEGLELIVQASQVPDPQFIRYGWANNPEDINLYNGAGLPLLPFRTD